MAKVDFAVEAGVGRVTLSNPERYNTMTLGMWKTLGDLLASLPERGDVRVLMLRGDGDRAFVSGADISEFESQRSDPTLTAAYDAAVARAQNGLSALDVPVVANIHGVCMGGGMGLAMACDLRYATRDARFRMPAARMGLGYSFHGICRMVETIGSARTADLFYTARTFDGVEAERIGLVHRTHDAAELDAAVEATVAQIAGNAPLTLRAAKLAIREAALDAPDRDLQRIDAAIQKCFGSEDYIEGRRAFMEKRPPRFTGR